MREETLCKQSCGSLKGEALQVEFAESASEGAGTCGGGEGGDFSPSWAPRLMDRSVMTPVAGVADSLFRPRMCEDQ